MNMAQSDNTMVGTTQQYTPRALGIIVDLASESSTSRNRPILSYWLRVGDDKDNKESGIYVINRKVIAKGKSKTNRNIISFEKAETCTEKDGEPRFIPGRPKPKSVERGQVQFYDAFKGKTDEWFEHLLSYAVSFPWVTLAEAQLWADAKTRHDGRHDVPATNITASTEGSSTSSSIMIHPRRWTEVISHLRPSKSTALQYNDRQWQVGHFRPGYHTEMIAPLMGRRIIFDKGVNMSAYGEDEIDMCFVMDDTFESIKHYLAPKTRHIQDGATGFGSTLVKGTVHKDYDKILNSPPGPAVRDGGEAVDTGGPSDPLVRELNHALRVGQLRKQERMKEDADWQARIRALESEADRLRDELKNRNDETATARQARDSLREEVTDLKEALHTERTAAAEEKRKLEDELQARDDEINTVRLESDSLSAEINALKETLHTERTAAAEEKRKLEDELQARDDDLNTIWPASQGLSAEINALKNTLHTERTAAAEEKRKLENELEKQRQENAGSPGGLESGATQSTYSSATVRRIEASLKAWSRHETPQRPPNAPSETIAYIDARGCLVMVLGADQHSAIGLTYLADNSDALVRLHVDWDNAKVMDNAYNLPIDTPSMKFSPIFDGMTIGDILNTCSYMSLYLNTYQRQGGQKMLHPTFNTIRSLALTCPRGEQYGGKRLEKTDLLARGNESIGEDTLVMSNSELERYSHHLSNYGFREPLCRLGNLFPEEEEMPPTPAQARSYNLDASLDEGI